MPVIEKILARQLYDSRGLPTIETQVFLKSKAMGSFITPSGASKGKKEALELRDGTDNSFKSKGVNKAIFNIQNEIAKNIINKNIENIKELDQILINLDGTENKSRLGANAILSVSAAFFKALALEHGRNLYEDVLKKEYFLPVPLINIINGGVHASNGLDIQEFMLVPHGFKTFRESIFMAALVFYNLRLLLKEHGFSVAVGDEGGFAPFLRSNEEALEFISIAIEKSGLKIKKDISIALDVAANEIYNVKNNTYKINNQNINYLELISYYEKLIKHFGICSIEDPFYEDDFNAYKIFNKKLGNYIQIVGDDLYATNEKYILAGIENKYTNAVLIKINQIGTISEAMSAVKMTKNAGFQAIMSHRSGETEDTTIADLTILFGINQIKTGSLSRSERVAKYNRLLRIEEELGDKALYWGSL